MTPCSSHVALLKHNDGTWLHAKQRCNDHNRVQVLGASCSTFVSTCMLTRCHPDNEHQTKHQGNCVCFSNSSAAVTPKYLHPASVSDTYSKFSILQLCLHRAHGARTTAARPAGAPCRAAAAAGSTASLARDVANLVFAGDGAVVAAAAAGAGAIHLHRGLVDVWRQVDAGVHHEEVAWPADTNAKLMWQLTAAKRFWQVQLRMKGHR